MTISTKEENLAAMNLVTREEMINFIKTKSAGEVKAAFEKRTSNLPWAYWLYLYTYENK